MEPGNLEPRVTALERDVGALSGQLRDFRADTAVNFEALRASTTASFNALREDFVDLRSHMDQGFAKVDQEFAKVDQEFAKVDQEFAKINQEFAKVDREFAKINREFAKVDRGFTEMRGKLDAAAAGQQQIVDLLQSFT